MILKRKSVLEDLKIEKNGISIEELPFVGKINLRGNANDRDFMSNTGSVLDIIIPLDPNTKVQNKKFQVIWLSPNEWLLCFYDSTSFLQIFEELNKRLNPEKTSITDTSENRTIIRIEGKNTSDLLKKFMILDIDKNLKDNLKVAQTIFVKIPVLIICNYNDQNNQSYDIHVNRSHTNYLRDLLLDGCN